MNDPAGMHLRQGVAQLTGDARRARALERALGQRRPQSLPIQERHRQAGLAGGADPGIQDADHARMLDRPQSGHFVRKPVANPALLARAPVEDLHGETAVPVEEIARFVNHRESPSRDDPAQVIAAG